MTALRYRDFDLRIARLRERDGTWSFDVWVEGATPAGEMRPDDAATVVWDDHVFWEHPATLFGGPAGRLENQRVEERHLRRLGKMLADLALPDGDVRRLFQESVKLQKSAGEGLRLRLHVDPIPLSRLPWEYLLLADDPGDDAATDFLALREEVSIVRTATVGTIPLAPPPRPAVHVVGVLSSPASTPEVRLAPLDLEKDRRALEVTASLLNAADPVLVPRWVESPASRMALRRALADSDGADIFHFGGHGAFDLVSGGGALYMEADGAPDPLPADELAVLLRDHGVRLAVLGACESSTGAGKGAWSGVAQALTRQQIPAVIGNQLTIRDDLAAELFFELYTGVLQGVTVDQALAKARIAMMNEAGLETRDWGAPTLFLHDGSGVLFPAPKTEAGAPGSPFARVTQTVATVRGRVTGAQVGRISRGQIEISQVVGDLHGDLIGLQVDEIGERGHVAVDQRIGDEAGPEAPDVEVGQRVRSLAGNIVGVAANVIDGNVSVTQIEIQVHARTPETQRDLLSPAAAPKRPPYPGPVPFSFDDRHLFFGRDTLGYELLSAVNDHPVVLLYGPAGSGKTSLVNARLLPHLASVGAVTVRLEDYADMAGTLRHGLAGSAQGLGLDAPADRTLPGLVSSITGGLRGTLLLVLDQFERLFDLPTARQEAALADIATLGATHDPLLRVVVGYRSDDSDSFARLTRLRGAIQDRIGREIEVPWLGRDEALLAIREPARQHGELSYEPLSLIDRIVSDLDALSAQVPGQIEPLSLQIVCRSLYQRARSAAIEDGFAVVNEGGYEGAEFIVGRYLSDLLTSEFAGVEELARRALHHLTLVSPDPWLAPDEIAAPPVTAAEARAVLDRMAELGLVIRRTSEPFEYSLANPAIRTAAERHSGTVALRQVARTLDDLWYGWITTGRLADRAQLTFLAEAPRLEIGLAQSLFLLASAVHSDGDVVLWRDRLGADGGELDAFERSDATPPMRSALQQLLGDPQAVSDVGMVTAGAVAGATATARDTAAVALTGVEDYPARIERGLGHVDGAWRRRRRRADIWSVIAECDGTAVVDEFPAADRMAIWLRRLGRRLRRRRRIFTQMGLWGALLAALVFGLYHLVSGPLTQAPGGLEFLQVFWVGLIFAGGALLPALVARFGFIRPTAAKTIAMGAVGFGVVNAVVTIATGVDPRQRPSATLLGLVVGASLAWVVTVDRPSPGHIALATVVAAVVFTAAHGLVQVIGERREAFQIVRNASFFAAELPSQGAFFANRSYRFFQVVSAIDAAVAGACLAFGIALGARLGARRTIRDGERG